MNTDAANATAAEFVRRKIGSIVNDPRVAKRLMPTDHPLGAKRLCIDTNYYDTFNRDNVTLVDLREDPIQSITAQGVLLASGEVADAVAVHRQLHGPSGRDDPPALAFKLGQRRGVADDDGLPAERGARAGQVRFRADKGGTVHCAIGNTSFEAKALHPTPRLKSMPLVCVLSDCPRSSTLGTSLSARTGESSLDFTPAESGRDAQVLTHRGRS